MATSNKRYYWLQLKENFFNSKEMKLMRKLPGGEEITIIYLKIMLTSLENEGVIFYEGLAEDLAEELALEIGEDVESIRMALMFMEKKRLITTNDNYSYKLEQVPELVGSETASARRVRKHRESKRLLQSNNEVTKCIGEIDIDIDIDKEIDIDIDKEIDIDLEKNTLKIIADEYQSRIAPLDGIQFESLKDFIALDGMEPDVILKAISLAADNGKRNFSYIRAILQNWKNDGLLSIAAVNERERKFQESKTKGQPTKQQSNVPYWSKPNYTNQTSDQEKKALEEAKNKMLQKLEKDGK
ncbi:phage replisome organizer N-terminal domain-containing protein [Streptococcus sp. GS001]|nr:phage replisome organizer N-terminal domain-containing protein [Streptococcus sp. GS001]MCF4964637.1 phage replisome organizer N-terminal domain-containing protein [Streptococcus sp. GS001]